MRASRAASASARRRRAPRRGAPSRSRLSPANAIMTALSPVSACGATRTSTPRERPHAGRRSLTSVFAATPPDTVRTLEALASWRRDRRSRSCATIASSTSAIRSQSPCGASSSRSEGPPEIPGTGARPSSPRRSRTAVLRPEKLKSGEPSLNCGTAKGRAARAAPREPVHRRARPDSRGPPSSRPCRRPRRPRRRASARGVRSGRPRTSRRACGRPRRRARRTSPAPGPPGRPLDPGTARARAPRCGSRERRARRSPSARPFPSERPTRSAPTRPGPAVAATAVTSASVAPASCERRVEERRAGSEDARAPRSRARRRRSGGGPPPATTTREARARPAPSRSATAVSSQDVSSARTSASFGRSSREEPCERVRVRRLGDSALRDDRVDEGRRGHVEGGVERGDARRARGTRCLRPAAAARPPPRRSRSSIGIDAPSGVARSTVVVGAATTNGTPCARHASARPYVPTLFATSPFAAMRSAPTTTPVDAAARRSAMPPRRPGGASRRARRA